MPTNEEIQKQTDALRESLNEVLKQNSLDRGHKIHLLRSMAQTLENDSPQ